MVQAIPEELAGRIVPYLLIDGAAKAIDFYEQAFDARERFRLEMPGGGIGHAELIIGGAFVYLADTPENPSRDGSDPKRLGGSTVLLHRYVVDVDAAVEKAVKAGATLVREPEDQFYGDRAAMVVDPFGHHWSMHTHIEDVSPEQMRAAMDGMTDEG